MCVRNLTASCRCSVDFATRPSNDVLILEVIYQRLVVGVEQARAADQSQCDHVLIVRGADVTPAERLSTVVDTLVNYRTGTSV